jgi:hypothetical protein
MKPPRRITKAQDDSAPGSDQDSAWKDLLDGCFPAFLEFFFPEIHRDVDWSHRWESLDKELSQIRPDLPGGTLYADKLFKVRLRNGRVRWILIHIEVQGQAGRGFPRRVFVYNYRIGEKYPGVEVVSLAVITETRRRVEGRYEVTNWGCSLVFTFPCAQLADYTDRWAELEANRNPFAVAVMAQLKALETRGNQQNRFAWKRRLALGLYERGYSRQQIVALFKFMDWVMRLPRDLEQRIKQAIYDIEEGKKVPYITTLERMAIEDGRREGRRTGKQEGLQQGLQQGQADLIADQLTLKLGGLTAPVRSRLKRLSPEQLRKLGVALFGFTKKSDLNEWLKKQTPRQNRKRK